MTTPTHLYSSVPLAAPPEQVLQRLLADPKELVTSATGDAISMLAPHLTAWRLRPSQLPTVDAAPTTDAGLGAVEITWQGIEDQTAWPSMTARLLVLPDLATGGSRLALASRRSPDAELTTVRTDARGRRRVVNVGLQRFLHVLADHLGGRGAAYPGATAFDRTPRFVHAVRTTPADPMDAASALATIHLDVVEGATRDVVAANADVLATGRFRRAAAPVVELELLTPGELGALRIRWRSDEEATGWPQLTWSLVVEADVTGSRLVLLADRPAGYDASLNRIDKDERDRLLRRTGSELLDRLVVALALDRAAARAGQPKLARAPA